MKKVLSLVVVLMLAMTSSAFAQGKVGVIDLQAALIQTEAGKKALSELQAEGQKAQARIQQLQNEIATMQKEIEAQRSVLSQDAIQKKLADIQKKQVEGERFVSDTQAELQRKEQAIVNSIAPGMVEVVNQYAKDNKYDFVIDAKAGVYYVAPANNITDAVVKIYNSKNK